MHKWRGTYTLMSTPNHRFLRSSSWQFDLLSEFLPEICWEEVVEVKLFFCILFCCLVWSSNPGFKSNKLTHHLLDYGDYLLKRVSLRSLMSIHTYFTRGEYEWSRGQGFTSNKPTQHLLDQFWFSNRTYQGFPL